MQGPDGTYGTYGTYGGELSMPRTCTICTHPERSVIEQQLIAGTPLRDIACQFGVGRMAVQRHAGEYLPEHLMKAADAADAAMLTGC
jgi:hypothetical protein